jgi:threonine dehydrogenase-like Zn-dependent dehydrogenase
MMRIPIIGVSAAGFEEAAMLAVAVDDNRNLSMVEIPQPVPGDYEAVIRTEVACLCNATDSEIINGELDAVDKYPTLLGHEGAGTVVQVGPKVRSYKVGDRVVGALLLEPTDSAFGSGFGGFCEYVVASDYPAMKADHAIEERPGQDIVFKIMRTVPQDIPTEAAALLCTWREVLGSFMDFRLHEVRRILVFGGGPVGLSFVRFARLRGMEYIGLVDSHPEKRDLAVRFGADETFSRNDPRLEKLARPAQGGQAAVEAVIDAAGREEILTAAVTIIPEGGRVCVYGLYRDRRVGLEIAAAPRNWSLLYHQWPIRNSESAAQEPLVDWLRSGELQWREFVTSRYPVREIAKGVTDIRSHKAIKVLLDY